MKYFEVNEARTMRGMRLVTTRGMPGPWSESAKKILEYKRIPYILVAQYAGDENADLKQWTGVRNAPVAMLDDEPPRTGWAEILEQAETIAPQPALLPHDPEERAIALRLANEICGEWGFGWCRRINIRGSMIGQPGSDDPRNQRMALDYKINPDTTAKALPRLVEILSMLTARLQDQRARGSRYFVGQDITACDIYWACFSQMVVPMAAEDCPMPDIVRERYGRKDAELAAAIDPILIDHRDVIFRQHFELPLQF